MEKSVYTKRNIYPDQDSVLVVVAVDGGGIIFINIRLPNPIIAN